MPMTDYFDFGDFKGFVIGILSTAAWLVIRRIWSNYSTTSINRRIKESETEKVKLDNLAKSDRALIILGFQGVFGMIAILCMILALQTPFFINRDPAVLDRRPVAQILLWFIPTLVCIAMVWTRREWQTILNLSKRSMRESQI